ncbi:MAG: phosphatidylserine decarboxylase [Elusimicrobia bacterium]|nr:phosphatidylserine decarboxylase [Elusimicrobiota bacterium]
MSASWPGGAFALYFPRSRPWGVPHPTEDVLSPADGRVMEVAAMDGEGVRRGARDRIFLSVLDVHVQRSPVAGKVIKAQYRPGSFWTPVPRAPRSRISQQHDIETPRGAWWVRQIAGLIARRILCWAGRTRLPELGQRFRVDTVRFARWTCICRQKWTFWWASARQVVSGETTVARWGRRGHDTNSQDFSGRFGIVGRNPLKVPEASTAPAPCGGASVLAVLFTIGNMAFGFFSLVKSVSYEFGAAATAMLLGHVLDILDGTVARLTRTSSRFGIELGFPGGLVHLFHRPVVLDVSIGPKGQQVLGVSPSPCCSSSAGRCGWRGLI